MADRPKRLAFGAPLAERIRHARQLAGLTQAELARRVNVGPSAVSQWEAEDGTAPSVANLIGIATHTKVAFEWLATGRGGIRSEAAGEDPSLLSDEFTRDHLEDRWLLAFRRISRRRRETILQLIESLAAPR